MEGRSELCTWPGVLLVLCCLAAGALGVQQYMFHKVADMDHVLPSTNPLFQEASTSDLRCAGHCSQHPDCQAFTFVGHKSGSCFGYCSVESQASNSTAVIEAKTYNMSIIPAIAPKSCQELLDSGQSQGVIELWTYTTRPTYIGPAFCDGPWLVFQRRQDGQVDFYRDWEDYRNGFGDAEGEHWLGLETLRHLTSQGHWNLRVDLRDKSGISAYAAYSNFRLGSEESFYPLLFDTYTDGTAGDGLNLHQGLPFTTRDRDHDRADINCALRCRGAWWYNNCHNSNLNGLYNNDNYAVGIIWRQWRGHQHSLPFSEMKIQKL